MGELSGRIVQVRATSDPKVVALKPDPELRYVMGTFTPARWNEQRHEYLLPTSQRRAFGVFARFHDLTVVHVFEKPPTVSGPELTPETIAAMDEVRRLRAEPDALRAATRRGVTLCRIVLNAAKLKSERKRSGTA